MWEGSLSRGAEHDLTRDATAPLRVLVVDDDPDIRQLLVTMLPGLCVCEIVGQADSGSSAIAGAETLRPDLIVMDVMMPVIDGCSATRTITSRWPDVRVVGFTAGNPQVHEAIVEAGAVRSIDKAELSSLVDFIADAAETRRQEG
jgi:CheY-like chemotaxis protein